MDDEQKQPADAVGSSEGLGLAPKRPIVPMPQPDLLLKIELPMVRGGAIKPNQLYTADSMRRYAAEIDEAWEMKLLRLRDALQDIAEGGDKWTSAGLVDIARCSLRSEYIIERDARLASEA
jgi:hypothetical protein